MQEQQNNSVKVFLISGVIIAICVGGFLLFDKLTSRDMKAVVVNRLSKGVVEVKEEVTPERKVLDAVNTNRSRVVKIYATSPKKSGENGTLKKGAFLARGIIYSDDGLIVTSRSYFQEGASYLIEIPGQKDVVMVKPLTMGKQFVTFKMDAKMTLVAEIDKSKLSKGDIVVSIGGQEEDTMVTGEIFLVDKSTDDTFIITTIPGKNVEIGTPLMNIKQKVIGLYTKVSTDGKAVFISVENIDKIVKK
jgi:S1-C subfamily serine protease